MKNANKIVYITLLLLLAAVAGLAFLNRGDAGLRRALEENREFFVRVNGEHAATISLQTLLDMNPQEFTTSFATSITMPRDVTLRGIELRLLLEALEIDLENISHIVVSGLDRHYAPLSVEEVRQDGLVYICFSMDGEILAPQGEGGLGPFLMAIRGSRFAQRWCKYVEAVDVIY
jgi:hypothetical protein